MSELTNLQARLNLADLLELDEYERLHLRIQIELLTIKEEKKTMRHYLFEDNDSGEQFIVGADSYIEACAMAEGIFNEPEYLCELSEFEAENSGLDEY